MGCDETTDSPQSSAGLASRSVGFDVLPAERLSVGLRFLFESERAIPYSFQAAALRLPLVAAPNGCDLATAELAISPLLLIGLQGFLYGLGHGESERRYNPQRQTQ